MPSDAPNTSTLRQRGPNWTEVIDGLDEVERSWVDMHLRPIVTMTTTPTTNEALDLGQSHFGGDPHLPENFDWPQSHLAPLRFLAQVAMADIRESAATLYYGLPKDGWLLFFACDEDGVQPGVVERGEEGKWLEIPDLMHVAHIPPGTPLVRTSNQSVGFIDPDMTPAEHAELGLSAEELACAREDWVCTVRFGEGYDLPNVGDVDQPPLSGSEAVEALQSLLREEWTSKLMGWPCHYRTDNTSPGPDWVNLVTLGSEDHVAWCWCDGEHLDVYVHEGGLANASFSPFYGYAA